MAALFFDALVDRQHAHIGYDDGAVKGLDAGDLLSALVATRQNDVDMVVWQDEPTRTALGQDVGRDRPHALGQDGRHVAGAFGLDQLRFADRLTGRERLPREGAGELLDRIRPLGSADEIRARRSRGPNLPAHILARNCGPGINVAAGDENVDSLDLHDLWSRRRFLVRSARKKSRDPAGGESNDEHDDARGFHDASPSKRCKPPAAIAHRRPSIVAASGGFQQAKVKAWLTRRIQIEIRWLLDAAPLARRDLVTSRSPS